MHVKTLRSQKLRMLLTHRKLLQSKAIAIENDLRGTLRNFGLKVGMVGKVRFEARIQELVENQPDLAVLVEPLLIVRRALLEQIVILHRRLLAIVRDDEVCRRLMTTPGARPRGGADLSRHRRRARSVPKIEVSRGGIWTDVRQVSIGRDRLERQNITLRRTWSRLVAGSTQSRMTHSGRSCAALGCIPLFCAPPPALAARRLPLVCYLWFHTGVKHLADRLATRRINCAR